MRNDVKGPPIGESTFRTMAMAKKTLEQVLKQIEDLQSVADNLRRKEIGEVIERIRQAVVHYGLTAADLGLARGGGGKGRVAGAARKKPGPKPGSKRKAAAGKTRKVAPKYRDEKGNTWAGRGQRPIWLREALAAGRRIEEFAIK